MNFREDCSIVACEPVVAGQGTVRGDQLGDTADLVCSFVTGRGEVDKRRRLFLKALVCKDVPLYPSRLSAALEN